MTKGTSAKVVKSTVHRSGACTVTYNKSLIALSTSELDVYTATCTCGFKTLPRNTFEDAVKHGTRHLGVKA